jgi:putative transposase
MSKTLDTKLATEALKMAINHRGTAPAILHSEQGATYAASDDRLLLTKHAIRQRMSRQEDRWDNAPMESFFHTLKPELVRHGNYETSDQARASRCHYMEVFYNRQRQHSTIRDEAPLAFEASIA